MCIRDSASTARLVNIALALKSDDESAVALDSLSIDLYTGDAVLYLSLIHISLRARYGVSFSSEKLRFLQTLAEHGLAVFDGSVLKTVFVTMLIQ